MVVVVVVVVVMVVVVVLREVMWAGMVMVCMCQVVFTYKGLSYTPRFLSRYLCLYYTY